MEDRMLGDVPSEANTYGQRFGIYRAHSPDPKMYSLSRVRMVFVTAIAAVVAFAIFFPIIQYTSRGSRKSIPLPIPEIVNHTMNGGVQNPNLDKMTTNCSTNVFSFGHDCTESVIGVEEQETKIENSDEGDIRRSDGSNNDQNRVTENIDETSLYQQDQPEFYDIRFHRRGRSRWPKVSTPYPYYLPVPTERPYPTTPDIQTLQQTNIFAVPLDSDKGEAENSSATVNFTPPPYAFTPFPNFTDTYAQLSPYRVPKNNTNFLEVMKYLKNIGASDRSAQVDKEVDVLQSRSTTMKVSGTYMMPLDRRRPGEIILSNPNQMEVEDPNAFYNGHAYVSDPFTNFRPANPSEINRLIPVKSGMNLGPRFRKPVSFVPTSSIAVDLTPPFRSPQEPLQSVASHTVAIFHPPGENPVSLSPPLIPRPTLEAPQEKPFSVTLDIYPVTMENLQESTSSGVGPRGRLNPKWRPKSTERPRWRPHMYGRPSPSTSAQPPLGSDNRMVVHLNLFPNKRRSYLFPRRSRMEEKIEMETTSLVSTNGNNLSTPISQDDIPAGLDKEDKFSSEVDDLDIVSERHQQSLENLPEPSETSNNSDPQPLALGGVREATENEEYSDVLHTGEEDTTTIFNNDFEADSNTAEDTTILNVMDKELTTPADQEVYDPSGIEAEEMTETTFSIDATTIPKYL